MEDSSKNGENNLVEMCATCFINAMKPGTKAEEFGKKASSLYRSFTFKQKERVRQLIKEKRDKGQNEGDIER